MQMGLLRKLQLDEGAFSADQKNRWANEARFFYSQLSSDLYNKNPTCYSLYLPTFFDRYSWEDSRMQKKAIAQLEISLKGSYVVDLGCGYNFPISLTLEFLKPFNIAGYVGVDICFGNGNTIINRPIEFPSLALPFSKDFPLAFLKDDMLLFSSTLLDRSVNVLMCGIDNCILRSHKYLDRLAGHVSRAIKDKGIIFGNNSTLPEHMRRLPGIEWINSRTFSNYGAFHFVGIKADGVSCLLQWKSI
jgi:hypothetical protein